MKSGDIHFIGRENEIRDILEYLKPGDDVKVVFISGEGGIGKTRLLNQIITTIEKNPDYKGFYINKIVDFDNKRFNSPENINFSIIESLPQKEEFAEYFNRLEELQKIERLDVRKTIEESKENVIKLFADTYNKVIKRTSVWPFDTIERLIEPEEDLAGNLKLNEEVINDLIEKARRLRNTCFVLVGRNPASDYIKQRFNSSNIKSLSIHLSPFTDEESKAYISAKEESLNISISPEKVDKLILLAEGKPIFLDMAVEWFVQKVDMEWLNTINASSFTGNAKSDFQEKLISRTRELNYPIDWVVFALAHVNPLDEKGFHILFDDDEIAGIPFESIKKIVFTKSLPDGAIKLHDEMQRIVEKYVFETIDKDLARRKYYSQKILPYLRATFSKQESLIEELSRKRYNTKDEKEEFRLKIQLEEKRYTLIEYTRQLIIHELYADPGNGKTMLKELWIKQVVGKFSTPEIKQLLYDLNKIKIPSLRDDLDFAINIVTLQYETRHDLDGILAVLGNLKDKASASQKIRILLLESNIWVSKGLVSKSIDILNQAENTNNTLQDKLFEITLQIELGWNYRLIGNLEEAQNKYRSAIGSILRETHGNWDDYKDLAIRYGWTLNNLAFVLSDSNKTRRDAVNHANSAIEHWKVLNHELGLGAGYSVLGITYYRIDKFEDALIQFRNALDIFENLKREDWICQVYSWRGALYQDRGASEDIKNSKIDLELSLKISETENRYIVPMTYNRLGRYYMSQKVWPLAFENMQESLNRAKQIPDYVYWLGSIARIGFIIAEFSKADYTLNDLYKEIDEFDKATKKYNILPEKNSLGMLKFALARLELRSLGKNPEEQKIDNIITLLKEGIPLITEYGSYARTDVRSRLAHLEKDFGQVNHNAINEIGEALLNFINEKITENSSYIVVVQIMNNWKNWRNN